MIPNEGLAMESGMSSGFSPLKRKKTRRGKRGGKKSGSPADHLKSASECLKSGDHAGCKQHAFALIKALPAKEREALEEQLEQDEQEPPPKAPNPNASSDARARLALALRAKNRKQS